MVSLAKTIDAMPGSVSSPYEKGSLQARPTAHAPARIAALAVLEKVVVEADTEAALVSFATRPIWASWASLSSTMILSYFNMLHLLESDAAAKLPWHPSGRGRRSSLGKTTKVAKALKARGEDLWRVRAINRVLSMASLRALESSLGKQRRFTCTLKLEISCRCQFSSPPEDWSMRLCKA
jgi:hypothetical protein